MTNQTPNYSNCWANSLGDCAGPMSGEHLFSKGLFTGPTVDVEGLSWCKNAPKKVGLKKFTKRCLCKHHNSTLSPTDDAAIAASAAIDDMQRRDTAWDADSTLPRAHHVVNVDGDLLERWFLKTLITNYVGKTYRVGSDKAAVGGVDPMWVDVAFARASFPGGSGLYCLAKVGALTGNRRKMWVVPITEKGTVIGGFFGFRGLAFLLWLRASAPPPRTPPGYTVAGHDVGDATASYHLEAIVSKRNDGGGHTIRMRYTKRAALSHTVTLSSP